MLDREKIIKGLEFTKAMITFNPLTGEDIEPEDLNEDNKITYDACVGAITLLKEQEAIKSHYNERTNWYECGVCHYPMIFGMHYKNEWIPAYKVGFCAKCGQAVKFE